MSPNPPFPTHFSNSLEPAGLIGHFLGHPPEGFEVLVTAAGQPGFYADFDLLTTADAVLTRRIDSLPAARWLRSLLKWRTLFYGTTVSEYAPMPAGLQGVELIRTMMEAWRRTTALLILKDIPDQSPLSTGEERGAAAALLNACQEQGFILVAGQALAYVPIDFASEEEYMGRLSAGRRKDIRRKLKKRAELRIEVIATGCERLRDPAFLAELYDLYLEVYAQSEIHFDKLTADFFAAVFRDESLDGHLFLYYAQERLIGFNLCFIHGGMFIDKYVGFRYPAARDYNLYFISWMENLAFARAHRLTHYVAGWTDPEIKSYLGARFTFTQHAVYVRNPILRAVLGKLSKHFEQDKAWFESRQQ